MRRLLGQGAIHCGRLARRILTLLLSLSVLTAVLLTGLVWRLSQGPLELAWLVENVERMVNGQGSPTRVTVGGAALTWEGFQHGLSSPLDLRLTDITVSDQGRGQRVTIPRVDVLLSVHHLLRFRLVPKAIEVDGPQFTLVRATDGTISLDIGTLQETAETMPAPSPSGGGQDLLRDLAEPMGAEGGNDLYTHLRTVRIRGASVSLRDQAMRATWQLSKADIELHRHPDGGADGAATMILALGQERPTLAATATLQPGAGGARLALSLTPVTPAALAGVAPELAVLSRIEAPLAISADIEADPSLRPRAGSVHVSLGAGQVQIGDAPVSLRDATMRATIGADSVTVDALTMTVQTRDAQTTVMRGSGKAMRRGDEIIASATIGFDRARFADLTMLWPTGAVPNARDWFLENVTTGVATEARVNLELAARSDLSNLRVVRVSGGLDADDLTVHWLRPIVPLERGRARLNFLDSDNLEVLITNARQKAGPRGGILTASGGRVVITGLSAKDQFMTVEADITGSVPAALDLLREPRLGLLDKQKIEFKDPSGDAAIRMRIFFPLEMKLRVEDVEAKVTAKLSRLRLAALVAGRDIDQGEIDLDATNAGMTIKGRAQLAAIGVQIDGTMDFREGPPSQVQRRASITGKASAKQLAAAGLDGEDWLSGDVTGTAVWSERRNGTADIAIEADLAQAELLVPPLLWSKPVGRTARGTGRVLLVRDQMRTIERVTIDGERLSFRGTLDCAENRIATVRIDRAQFGRNDVRGTIRLPARQPVSVELTGTIDAEAKLQERAAKPDPDGQPTKPWSINSQFDQVFLAHGKIASRVMARGNYDGRIFPALTVGGLLGMDKPFRMDISGPRGQRRLNVHGEDAGALLQGLDLIKTMEGGTLGVTGTFDDSRADHRLTGTARVTDFRARGSVGLAKLLQAMTLYGLVDVLRGPGIGFTELIAPFQKDDHQIVLNDARAMSPSLGLTAKGTLIPHEDRIDVEGTIVPAYFFNSLLGHIPLVGKLFSPETGGGVFAARYGVRGSLGDPSILVNPLSALTPGFLREIFGIF